jgi:2-C-methyl-D-erythritol 4-phosphate cytidylyltransferase
MAAHDQLIVAAIVVAAGVGSRLGAQVPKAFVELGGATLLEHAVAGLRAHPRVMSGVVVVPADRVDEARERTGFAAVAGGTTRQESVDAGLRQVGGAQRVADLVLVHDAARPFVPVDVIDRVLAALDRGADAAIPALTVTDTIKQVDEAGHVLATLERRALVAVQTPQGFRRSALAAAHANSRRLDATDDAALVEADGGQVVVVTGDQRAFKVTTPLDLALAEVLAHG